MRSTAATLALALVCIAPAVHAQTLTTWRIPYDDAAAVQLAATPTAVFYVDAFGQIGEVSTATGIFRAWKLPFFASNPGGIQFQPLDGTLFVTSVQDCAIGQFDPDTQLFRKWQLPVCPRDLTTDAQGRLVFTSHSPDASAFFVGRLDPVTNTAETWQIPDLMLTPGDDFADAIAVSPSGGLFFHVNGFRHRVVVQLTPSTGVFDAWNVQAQPFYGTATDPAGNFLFQEIDAGGVRRIARLSPTSGHLTEWDFAGDFDQDLMFESGRAFFMQFSPTPAVVALDTSVPGSDTSPSVFSSGPTVSSVSSILPTVTRHHLFRVGFTLPRVVHASSSTSGAFTSWPVAGSGRSTTSSGSVFFTTTTSSGHPAIGKLTP
jgi:streptogramin lyase